MYAKFLLGTICGSTFHRPFSSAISFRVGVSNTLKRVSEANDSAIMVLVCSLNSSDGVGLKYKGEQAHCCTSEVPRSTLIDPHILIMYDPEHFWTWLWGSGCIQTLKSAKNCNSYGYLRPSSKRFPNDSRCKRLLYLVFLTSLLNIWDSFTDRVNFKENQCMKRVVLKKLRRNPSHLCLHQSIFLAF